VIIGFLSGARPFAPPRLRSVTASEAQHDADAGTPKRKNDRACRVQSRQPVLTVGSGDLSGILSNPHSVNLEMPDSKSQRQTRQLSARVKREDLRHLGS
jgi:hypothetical protein